MVAVGLLCGLGLVMVLSASSVIAVEQSGSSWSIVARQAGWLVAGGAAAWARVAGVDEDLAGPCGRAPAAGGHRHAGVAGGVGGPARPAVRPCPSWWTSTAPPAGSASGRSSVQPSELAKLALVLWLAKLLAERRRNLGTWDGITPVLACSRRDRGPGAGGRRPGHHHAPGRRRCSRCCSWPASPVGTVLGLGAGLATVAAGSLLFLEPFRVTADHGLPRPGPDPSSAGYQTIQSQIGLASGGLFGIRAGVRQGQVGLPARGPHRLHLRHHRRGAGPDGRAGRWSASFVAFWSAGVRDRPAAPGPPSVAWSRSASPPGSACRPSINIGVTVGHAAHHRRPAAVRVLRRLVAALSHGRRRRPAARSPDGPMTGAGTGEPHLGRDRRRRHRRPRPARPGRRPRPGRPRPRRGVDPLRGRRAGDRGRRWCPGPASPSPCCPAGASSAASPWTTSARCWGCSGPRCWPSAWCGAAGPPVVLALGGYASVAVRPRRRAVAGADRGGRAERPGRGGQPAGRPGSPGPARCPFPETDLPRAGGHRQPGARRDPGRRPATGDRAGARARSGCRPTRDVVVACSAARSGRGGSTRPRAGRGASAGPDAAPTAGRPPRGRRPGLGRPPADARDELPAGSGLRLPAGALRGPHGPGAGRRRPGRLPGRGHHRGRAGRGRPARRCSCRCPSPPATTRPPTPRPLVRAGAAVLVPDAELDADRLVRGGRTPAGRPDRRCRRDAGRHGVGRPGPGPARRGRPAVADLVERARPLTCADLVPAAASVHVVGVGRRGHERHRHRAGQHGPPGERQRPARLAGPRPPAGDRASTCAVGHDAATSATSTWCAPAPPSARGQPRGRRGPGAGHPGAAGADLLAAIAAVRRTVAVAGTHGKTTTSSMLALVAAGGGGGPVVHHRRRRHRARRRRGLGDRASGSWSRPTRATAPFLDRCPARRPSSPTSSPTTSSTTAGGTSLRAAFGRFVAGADGPAVVCADDPEAPAARTRRPAPSPTARADDADYRMVEPGAGSGRQPVHAAHQRTGSSAGEVDVVPPSPGCTTPATRPAPLAVVARARAATVAGAAAGLAGFGGVARRFELRGEAGGVTFVDDYAHLPDRGARPPWRPAASGGWGRVVAVFQPHRYSRTAGAVAGLRRRVRRRRPAGGHRRLRRRARRRGPGSPASCWSTRCSTRTRGGALAWLPALDDVVDYLATRAAARRPLPDPRRRRPDHGARPGRWPARCGRAA